MSIPAHSKAVKYVLLAVLFLASLSAPAFEIDAFRSGMNKAEVKKLLADWKFDQVQEFSGDTMIAYDFPEKTTGRQFTFSFCNDRLVSFEQEMKPSVKNFIVISSNYNRTYGQPLKVEAASNVTSLGEKNQLALYWRKGTELVGLKYVLLPPHEQLLAVYETPNTCWQIPR